jgi:hypothetical protein
MRSKLRMIAGTRPIASPLSSTTRRPTACFPIVLPTSASEPM